MKKYTVTWAIDIDAYTPEHAAEKAKEIMLDSNSTANVFYVESEEDDKRYDIDLDSQEYLEKKIKDLANDIYGLECSDDFLFSNRNGNKERYDALVKEHSEVCKKLAALR